MTKRFEVYLLDIAEKDIDEIYIYIKHHDSGEKAERLSRNIEQAILSLHTSPLRGHYPPELDGSAFLNIVKFFFEPYK